jgi:hypothetical protein
MVSLHICQLTYAEYISTPFSKMGLLSRSNTYKAIITCSLPKYVKSGFEWEITIIDGLVALYFGVRNMRQSRLIMTHFPLLHFDC